MKFRKKPVVIDAVQLTKEVALAYLQDRTPLPAGVEFSSASHKEGKINSFYAHIQTLEGRMDVSLGDWVITGIKGEHYPCKPDIFAATYEPADVSAPSLADAARVLAEFAKTAPGRLPSRVQEALAVVDGVQASPDREPTWVLLSRPGMSAQRKGPFRDGRLVEQMVRDLYEIYPDATCLVIDAPHTTYPTDGREWVAMYGDQRRKRIQPAREVPPGVIVPDGGQQ